MYVRGAYRAALSMQRCHRAATWLGQVSNRVLEQQQHSQQGYGVAWPGMQSTVGAATALPTGLSSGMVRCAIL